MKKIAALVETTPDHAAATVKNGSTVFSVQQQQRAVSKLKSSASNTHNKACHKAPAQVITMNVSGGNSKEIFELFTNKLVFSVSVLQRWRIRWWSWLAFSSLDSPLERSASSRIIMKEFLFSIWFISLSSNLKLSIDIFVMSVSHVFADFRFIFVKCSCSRGDGTSLFSLFYKISLYMQGSRLRPFFESVRVKIWGGGRTCASAWSALLQSARCQRSTL